MQHTKIEWLQLCIEEYMCIYIKCIFVTTVDNKRSQENEREQEGYAKSWRQNMEKGNNAIML